MIIDEFLADPNRARALINQMEMRDEKYADGVTYPNIAMLPESVSREIHQNMEMLVGPMFSPVLEFARYSFADVQPPHWAHSDRNIAQFLALIYLTTDRAAEKYGTVCLKHKELKFSTHPVNNVQKDILLTQANQKDAWEVVFECPGKFNRCLILNADLIHAAAGEYGTGKEDGRLVVSVFFNLEQAKQTW